MASLLSLPVELLDRIIELVILDARLPPATLDAARHNRYTDEEMPSWGVHGLLSWFCGPRGVRYEYQTTANATGLLLTNSQLYGQTTDPITRLYPHGVDYHLDVVVVNETELWPTWLHVPAVAKRLASIQVNFRIFDCANKPFGLVRGDGGPPWLEWSFYYLLERFLRCGLMHPPPTSRGEPYRGDSISAIDTISLNFSIGARIPELVETRTTNWDLSYNVALDQTSLADFVHRALMGMSLLGYHESLYGCPLYERIGILDFSVDGMQRDILALGPELAARAFHAAPNPPASSTSPVFTNHTFGHLPGDCRLLTAWNWKYYAVQERKRLGLQMPELITWPKLNTWLEWKTAREDSNEPHGNVPHEQCRCTESGLEAMLMSRLMATTVA